MEDFMSKKAEAKKRAHEIRNEIKRLAEELKSLPYDEEGNINWNLHRAARVIIMDCATISEAVKS
jgi:hypothetical protein